MDKFTNSSWFFKVISLLLAILLYISVSVEGQVSTTSGGFTDTTDTINDIKVIAQYDSDNLLVTGIPESVSMTLQGSNSIVKTAILERKYELYVDLTSLPLGTHTVPIHYRNISDKLTVKIKPAEIKVTIYEKVTKNFPVQVQYINKDKLIEGYKLQDPLIKPKQVSITGPKETIDTIASVKAFVDLSGVQETFSKDVTVRAYTSAGEEVPITIDPSTVNVTVPVISPSKMVSIGIQQKGQLPSDLELVSIEVVPNEVTIFGPLSQIKSISSINNIEVDLSSITDNAVIEKSIPLPDGVEKALPDKVTIKVTVKKMMQKRIENVPIEITNVGSEYTAKITGPANGNSTITVYGEQSLVTNIKASDLSVVVDASTLTEGTHKVPIILKGPEGVQVTADVTEATITIQQQNTTTEQAPQ